MPAKRQLTMRQIRRLLRLQHEGAATREIGRVLGVARSTVQDALKRAEAAGVSWSLAADVTDEVLTERLFARTRSAVGARRRPGVNMTVLWEEYRDSCPDSYGYSRFCDLLRGFERRLSR